MGTSGDGDRCDEAAAGDDASALRKRLRKRLAGGRSDRRPPAAPQGHGAGTVFFGRAPAANATGAPRAAPAPPDEKVLLEQAVGGTVVETDAGRAFIIDRPVAQIDSKWAALCEALGRCIADHDSPLWTHLAGVVGRGELELEDVIFLDLETTGLGSSPLFLIGTMLCRDGQLAVRQFFARDYSEERPALSLFLAEAADKKLLVSFNGKSFDLPYVRVRAAATRLPCTLETPHLDLLHVSRRIWKGRLADCKLQTLERFVCGRMRSSDIPGWRIPQAYHDYVRTGNAWQMVDCLEHNMLDLITLAELMTKLPGK